MVSIIDLKSDIEKIPFYKELNLKHVNNIHLHFHGTSTILEGCYRYENKYLIISFHLDTYWRLNFSIDFAIKDNPLEKIPLKDIKRKFINIYTRCFNKYDINDIIFAEQREAKKILTSIDFDKYDRIEVIDF